MNTHFFFFKFLVGITIMACIASCEEADFDSSLLEPVFTEHKLSEVLSEGQVIEEYYYDSDGRLDSVAYFQNGNLSFYENHTYDGGQVAERVMYDRGDIANQVVSYEYDMTGRLVRRSVCNRSGICTDYTYFYGDRSACSLDSIKVTSPSFVEDGQAFSLVWIYTYNNYNTCSGTIQYNANIQGERSQFRIRTEVIEKSVDGYINPYFGLYPEQEPYINWSVLNFDNINGRLISEDYVSQIFVNNSQYPTEITYNNLNVDSGEELSSAFEYKYN